MTTIDTAISGCIEANGISATITYVAVLSVSCVLSCLVDFPCLPFGRYAVSAEFESGSTLMINFIILFKGQDEALKTW